MSIKTDLEAKLSEIDAKWNAERAPIQAELDKAGSWLEQEWQDFENWAANLLAKKPPTPPTVV